MKNYHIISAANVTIAEISLHKAALDDEHKADMVIRQVAQEFANIFETEVFIDEIFNGTALPMRIACRPNNT